MTLFRAKSYGAIFIKLKRTGNIECANQVLI